MSDILQILKRVGAILTDDHFIFVSGKHSDVYVNKDALYPHVAETSQVGKMMAQKFVDYDIDVVVGPALGGIILSQWTAHHLSQLKKREVLSVYTEKVVDDNQVFTRGYDAIVKGKNVLVVEDTTTTGGSAKKVVNSVQAAGGSVVAVTVMINRDPKNITSDYFGVPFDSLGVLEASAYDPQQCPLCKKGIAVNREIGHGKKLVT